MLSIVMKAIHVPTLLPNSDDILCGLQSNNAATTLSPGQVPPIDSVADPLAVFFPLHPLAIDMLS